jgi:hypothetical protein
MTGAHFYGRQTISAVVLLFLLTACTTGVNSVWIKPERTATPYQHLIVIGVANQAKVKTAYEENFIQAFTVAGLEARPSTALILKRKREKNIQKALLQAGADGLLITHLSAEPVKSTTPPPLRAATVPDSYQQLLPYYQQIQRDITSPGYYSNYQELRLETNLYDAKTGALMWSGRSQPLDPDSEQTISQVMNQIITQLRADGLLPPMKANATPQSNF